MLSSIKQGITRQTLALFALGLTVALATSMYLADLSSAAADPTTGIDYTAVAGDTMDSAKPAVVAGVVILTLITAVTLGKRLWNKVSH